MYILGIANKFKYIQRGHTLVLLPLYIRIYEIYMLALLIGLWVLHVSSVTANEYNPILVVFQT